jgi:hypothetical protein
MSEEAKQTETKEQAKQKLIVAAENFVVSECKPESSTPTPTQGDTTVAAATNQEDTTVAAATKQEDTTGEEQAGALTAAAGKGGSRRRKTKRSKKTKKTSRSRKTKKSKRRKAKKVRFV